MSIGDAVFYVGSFITVMGSLTIILRALLSPIEKQVNNHIPTQIKELKDDQREMRSELREDRKAFDQKFDQINQKFDQTNHKIDQNFREIIRLLSKDRAS